MLILYKYLCFRPCLTLVLRLAFSKKVYVSHLQQLLINVNVKYETALEYYRHAERLFYSRLQDNDFLIRSCCEKAEPRRLLRKGDFLRLVSTKSSFREKQ